MVSDRCGQRASEGERVGAALVRAEPPAAGHRLVHRAADERVPEAEAPGNVCLTDEIQAQQLVDRVDRRRLGGSGGRGGQLGIEGLSRDGSALEDEARLLGEQSELLGERGSDRSRDVDAGERKLVGRRRRVGMVGRPRELLEVERIAPAVLVEAGRVRLVADELPGLLGAERPKLDALDRADAVRPLDRGGEPLSHLPRSRGERNEDRRGRRSVEKRGRAARPTPDRPSGRRRARAPRAGLARASRAARRRRGDCGSARAGSRSCARARGRSVTGRRWRALPGHRRRGFRGDVDRGRGRTRRARRRRSRTAGRPRARPPGRRARGTRVRLHEQPTRPGGASCRFLARRPARAPRMVPADLREETVDRAELRRAADEMGGKCHLSLPASP